jgi:hypothetical protein
MMGRTLGSEDEPSSGKHTGGDGSRYRSISSKFSTYLIKELRSEADYPALGPLLTETGSRAAAFHKQRESA